MKISKEIRKTNLNDELHQKLNKFEDLFIKLVIPKIEKKIKTQKKIHEKETDKKYKIVKNFIKRPNLRSAKKTFNLEKLIFLKEKEKFKLLIFKSKFNEQLTNFSNTVHKLNRINEKLIQISKNNKKYKRKSLKKNVTILKAKEKFYLKNKIRSKSIKDKLIHVLQKHIR